MAQESTESIILSPRQVATGDPAGNALENINTNVLGDGAICYVESGAGQGSWQLQKSSTDTPDGTTIVAPTAGPGRWFIKSFPGPAQVPGAVFDVARHVEIEITNDIVAGVAAELTNGWEAVDPDDLVLLAPHVMGGINGYVPIACKAGEGSVDIMILAISDVFAGDFVFLSLYRYRAPA